MSHSLHHVSARSSRRNSQREVPRASGTPMDLEREADFAVVGEFDQTSCLHSVADLKPHVLIVHQEDVDPTKASLADATSASILLLSDVKLAKPESCGTVADCYLSTDVSRMWFLHALRNLVHKPGWNQGSLGVNPFRNLTERERQILDLIGAGHTNNEIAKQLNLSVRTIESHRSRIRSKLGAFTRADLVGRLNAVGPHKNSSRRSSPGSPF